MVSYNEFKEYISKFTSVHSINGKTYNNIHIEEDFVFFTREGKSEEEHINLQEMYNFYNSQPIESINTNMAKLYITGRVQSPAVAILRTIYILSSNEGNHNTTSELKKGCLAFIIPIIVAVFICICMKACFNNDNADNNDSIDVLSKPHTKCVINEETYGVSDETYLDRTKYLISNEDHVALAQLQAMGILKHITKGEKGIYIRHLRGYYVVVKLEGRSRPVIIPSHKVSKIKNSD